LVSSLYFATVLNHRYLWRVLLKLKLRTSSASFIAVTNCQYFCSSTQNRKNTLTIEHCLIICLIFYIPQYTSICIVSSSYLAWSVECLHSNFTNGDIQRSTVNKFSMGTLTLARITIEVSPISLVSKNKRQRWLPRDTSNHFDRTAACDRQTDRPLSRL